MQIDLINMPLDTLAALFFAAAIQVWKYFNPEVAEKDKKWIAVAVILLTIVVSAIRFSIPIITLGQPIASSMPELILMFVSSLLSAAFAGAVAVGAYEVGHNMRVPLFQSTSEILVAKTEVTKRTEVLEEVTVAPKVEEVKTELVTEVTYEPKVAEFESSPVEIKTSKKNKNGKEKV